MQKKFRWDNISKEQEQGKAEKLYMAFGKAKYDFVPGVNEKITDDKVLQNEKILQMKDPLIFLQ